MTYYIAKEPCYIGTRLLDAGDGIETSFEKGKVPPYVVEGTPPEEGAPVDELAVLRAEVEALKAAAVKPAKKTDG